MLSHIENQADYQEYKTRVEAFFKRERILYLSFNLDEQSYFSNVKCDCCARPLGGDRYDCQGYNPSNNEIQDDYSICFDCIYFAEYGTLDDMTMLDKQLTY
jgi:hypothetical protein